MKIFAERDEAAERLEELISFAERNDEVIICRDGVAIAVLAPVPKSFDGSSDRLLALMADGRPAAAGQTSNHDDFYDENGLPI